MAPLVLAGILAALIFVPLVLIAFFTVIGKIFSAPDRFGTILFVVLFVAALGGASWVYLRAGTVSSATVTAVSERIVSDDALRTRHQFELTVQIPGQTSRQSAKTIAVPARIYDTAQAGSQVEVRSGSVLGLKVARAEGERVTDLMPLGSIVCGILVVLLTAVAASSRTARAPVILLTFAALAGIGVQPAIAALPQGGVTMTALATVKGVTPVSSSAVGSPALAYLRGPFSIDHRWMWTNAASLRFVAVTFIPDQASTEVTAVDVVGSSPVPAIGSQVEVRYLAGDPRNVTLPGSQAAGCAWILLGILAGIEVLLLIIGVVVWRVRSRRRRRREQRQIDLDRDVTRDIERSTRRDGVPAGPGGPAGPGVPGVPGAVPELSDETVPLQPVPAADPAEYPASYPASSGEDLGAQTRPMPAVPPGSEPPSSPPPPGYSPPGYPPPGSPPPAWRPMPEPAPWPPGPVPAPPPPRHSSPPA